MKQHEHADVLRAIADGKTVQYKYAEYDTDWMDCNSDDLPMVNPLEDAHLVWRVKPGATL